VFNLILGELRSGRRLVAVPVAEGDFQIASGDAGSMTVSIPLTAAEFKRLERSTSDSQFPGAGLFPSPQTFPQGAVVRWRPGLGHRSDIAVTTEPTRVFMAILAGDRVIEAGPVWFRSEDEEGRLTLRGSGLRSMFDHRLLLSQLVAWHEAGAVATSSLSWSGLSLGTIAKRLVQEVLGHAGGDLPIVLPPDEIGVHERNYPGSELATAAQRLRELSEVEGGPEIAFEPRLTADRMGVEWVMRVGTTANPMLHQAGLDWVLDTSAPRGPVAAFTVSEDASSVVTRAFAKGSGTDEATLISRPATRGDLIATGFPLLESARSYTNVLEQPTIDSHAAADLAGNDRPWQTWTLRVRADSRVGQYRPGDWWSIRVGPGRVLVEPGVHRARCASIRGRFGDEFVDLSMVPMEVAG